jgi:hypothetical protein
VDRGKKGEFEVRGAEVGSDDSSQPFEASFESTPVPTPYTGGDQARVSPSWEAVSSSECNGANRPAGRSGLAEFKGRVSILRRDHRLASGMDQRRNQDGEKTESPSFIKKTSALRKPGPGSR